MTRAQWEEMWENAKRLQTIANQIDKKNPKFCRLLEEEITNIKRLIQSEIGQME